MVRQHPEINENKDHSTMEAVDSYGRMLQTSTLHL